MKELVGKDEGYRLFRWARASIASHLEARATMGATASRPEGGIFEEGMGAFVSLHTATGALRGCIGRIVTDRPLAQTVGEMAQAAAFQDPRFAPLEAQEYDEVVLEITILSPLRKIADIAEIEVGRHGLYLVKAWRSGVFLPQVAPEQGWDRAKLLENLCYKAGLGADAWRAPDTELFTFEGLVLHEEDYLPRSERHPASGNP